MEKKIPLDTNTKCRPYLRSTSKDKHNISNVPFSCPGGVPYDILKPVLERCTAEQLYQLEHYNPYLMEETGPHWQFHCNRDFRGQKLQEYETWRELYLVRINQEDNFYQ